MRRNSFCGELIGLELHENCIGKYIKAEFKEEKEDKILIHTFPKILIPKNIYCTTEILRMVDLEYKVCITIEDIIGNKFWLEKGYIPGVSKDENDLYYVSTKTIPKPKKMIPKPKKMTLEQIEEALGYPVEIVED